MNYIKLGALAALAGVGFVACSGDQQPVNESGTSSVSMKLQTPEGVLITEVQYDLNTQAGADVKEGVIPVPNPDSVADAFIGALPLGDYSLNVSASATYEGQTISCSSAAATLFSLTTPNSTTPLGNVALTCTIQVPVGSEVANVTFTVDVQVETIPVLVNAIETFTVAPTTAAAAVVDGACMWAPISIDVSNINAEIAYSWSATPDGTFALNPTSTVGSYLCASQGAKTLTVTATYQGASASIDVPVSCNACEGEPPPCGDGVVGPGEECDNSEPWCVGCQIDPICGDGVPHEVGTCAACDEECDDGNLADGDGCSSTCTIEPTFECPAGLMECPAGSEMCVDTQTDEANCGACGNACDAGDTCEAGVCSGEPDPIPAACFDCINALPGVGEFNTGVCEASGECVATRNCALTPVDATVGACYTPIPAECFCGIGANLDQCENADFFSSNPFGPCTEEIFAGLPAGTSPGEALSLFYSFDYPSGQAMAIVEEARVNCSAECNL